MASRDKLVEFVAWCSKNITGDEKAQAQIFLDREVTSKHCPGAPNFDSAAYSSAAT